MLGEAQNPELRAQHRGATGRKELRTELSLSVSVCVCVCVGMDVVLLRGPKLRKVFQRDGLQNSKKIPPPHVQGAESDLM